jgi:hypothetical protein
VDPDACSSNVLSGWASVSTIAIRPTRAVCSSARLARHNQRNRYERESHVSRGPGIGSSGQVRLKNVRGFFRKSDTKGFRYWNLGNLAISANFGGIHYEGISESL